MRLYNTLTRKIEEFTPLNDKLVTIYTCGPTVYDYAHIGNFRTFCFEDLMRRYLKFRGYQVKQVMNLTDVDDKTIRKAAEQGLGLDEYTKKYIEAFMEDCKTLNMESVEFYPRATRTIEEMIELVSTLLEKGHAYEKDGSVYFNISSLPTYGRLSGLDRREIRTGVSVDSDEYEKDDVRDFVLWKGKKEENEPAWHSPFGEGRPGWHLECSVMSMKYLGETLDIHAGGEDLIFPHHENEIAQSEAATGKTFVRHWVHCKYLIVEGKKMSKSLGNFFTLRQLLEKGYDPMAIRYTLIAAHYRKQLNFTFDSLENAAKAIGRVESFYNAVSQTANRNPRSGSVSELITKYRAQFTAAMDDDLNISGGLAALFEFIREINTKYPDSQVPEDNKTEILAFLDELNTVIACFHFGEELADEEIMKLIDERNQARKDRNFARADEIRDQLKEMGIILEDTRDATRFKRLKQVKS
ncbi:MAG: cysteine--tRNA ligase [Acidobacteria bacterium]|nr:cysteine--tRNA ligase [Acidobacteriota bacterium]